jgi:hypothetical protein
MNKNPKMNKNLKEVLAEATWYVGNNFDPNKYSDIELDVKLQETYAQFLIERAIKVMIEHGYHGEWLGEKIKEHFGIPNERNHNDK